MAVSRVSQREIVEVPYLLPYGSIKPHMALVLSTERPARDKHRQGHRREERQEVRG